MGFLDRFRKKGEKPPVFEDGPKVYFQVRSYHEGGRETDFGKNRYDVLGKAGRLDDISSALERHSKQSDQKLDLQIYRVEETGEEIKKESRVDITRQKRRV